MADLTGAGPPTSTGNGRPSRTQAAPGTTGSPRYEGRGPREIMRDRQAREQRRREEAERAELERINAEEEARQLEIDKRRSDERRAAAAAGQRGSGEGGQRGSGGTTGQRVSDNSQRSERIRIPSGEQPPDQPLQGVGRGGRAIGGGEASRQRPTASQQQSKPIPPDTSRRPTHAQPEPTTAGPSNAAPAAAAGRSSFPHAFERWETLSAHWEGLTSFWIRRLEENSAEVNRDPITQQLSRQVTDLSAAGANLFHAVVELQRLRASSERKFQRWFFETRAEQERAQEVQAITEASLEQERRERAAAIAEAVEKERRNSNAEKQLAEMKRELQISKEEARRAWEELGRREQEEREKVASLREGQPTIVGGVQVVPMMQGVPSRHESARDPQGQGRDDGPIEDSDIAFQAYSRAQRADPADPFVEQSSRGERSRHAATSAPVAYEDYSQAPAVQPAATAAFYQQGQPTLHSVDPTNRSENDPSYGPSVGSGAAFSDEGEYEIDEEGRFVRDERGNKIPYQNVISDDDTDEFEADARKQEVAHLRGYGRAPAPMSGVEYGHGSTATAGGGLAPPTSHLSSTSSGGPDYAGQGYGGFYEQRHHHPTRLSDVVEEDERSRTSASQVSRRED